MRKEKVNRRSAIVGLALLVTFLPGLTLLTRAGAPVGTQFPIRAEGEVEVNPAIAYNSQWHEYLVVLWNDRSGCDDVRAERVDGNGARLGGWWVAAGCPAERRYPDVAYNSQSNDWLVVWLEEEGGVSSIKAQRLWADGELKGGQITVFSGVIGVQTSAHPAVAYASTSDNYLVVWELEVLIPTPPPGYTVTSIVGRIVAGDGSMPSTEFVISQDSGTEPRQQPDVAYNRHANGFLVAWQQLDSTHTLWSIYGRLINGDGGMPFASFAIDVNSTAPAVAALPTSASNYKFMVVYEWAHPAGNKDIRGVEVEENGTPAPHFAISTGYMDEVSPAVAGDEAGQRYLVAWRHPLGVVDVPIHGRAVSAGGYILYDEDEFGGPTADYPAVAAGSAGTFLVAWQDKAPWATHTDIYGQFWGTHAYLPVVVRNQ